MELQSQETLHRCHLFQKTHNASQSWNSGRMLRSHSYFDAILNTTRNTLFRDCLRVTFSLQNLALHHFATPLSRYEIQRTTQNRRNETNNRDSYCTFSVNIRRVYNLHTVSISYFGVRSNGHTHSSLLRSNWDLCKDALWIQHCFCMTYHCAMYCTWQGLPLALLKLQSKGDDSWW